MLWCPRSRWLSPHNMKLIWNHVLCITQRMCYRWSLDIIKYRNSTIRIRFLLSSPWSMKFRSDINQRILWNWLRMAMNFSFHHLKSSTLTHPEKKNNHWKRTTARRRITINDEHQSSVEKSNYFYSKTVWARKSYQSRWMSNEKLMIILMNIHHSQAISRLWKVFLNNYKPVREV